jgi:hypothetical protein
MKEDEKGEDVGGGLGGGLSQGGVLPLDGDEGLDVTSYDQPQEKEKWWPSCFHSKMSRLATKKFPDRIVILWKCRNCPKRVTETIEINQNSRKVFVKSTTSSLPRSDETADE